MTSSSYTLLNNPTDKLDVQLPIKESIPMLSTMNSNEALKKRYIQIACAVALYWSVTCSLLLILHIVQCFC
jgi:hypothetical protein